MMRWLTGTLSMRLFFVVLGGVVLASAIGNSLHRHDRTRLIEEYREHNAIEHLSDAIRLLAVLPSSLRVSAIQALPSDEWFVAAGQPGQIAGYRLGEAAPTIAKTLRGILDGIAQVDGAWLERSGQCVDEPPVCSNAVWIRMKFPENQAIDLGYALKVRERLRHYEMFGFRSRDLLLIGIMAVVAWVVVRLALRPLQRMAQAAENFGRDIAHPPIDESGPIEVRRAAQAFNAMQEQIRADMSERTQILSAVTHDLKTPLTRMRLRLENCADDVLKEKLKGDLAAMQSLVEEGLELARSLDTTEATQPVNLDALLQSLCDDFAETGMRVAYSGVVGSGVLVAGKPNALGRVFANIIDNAVKYGQYARVSLELRDDIARVHICDGGPGIPEKRLQDVLKPFVRLEASRSRETGGTGLGLAIAVNLLKIQQGEISLHTLPEGGLEVTVQLPIAPARK